MGCDRDRPEQPETGSTLPIMGTSRTGLCFRGVVGVAVSQEIGFGPM